VTISSRSTSRRRWLAGSVAAAIAVAVGLPNFWHSDTVYSTQTESRQIALGEGVQVDLAPASRLIAKGGDPTRLELAEGEAYFDVVHDPKRTLAVQAGDASVTDIGTKFTMNLAPQTLIVAVADGHVSVVPDKGDATQVGAGQQLLARRGGAAPRLTAIAASDVGSWRGGRLVYDHTPLSAVVADISRYSGEVVAVEPAIADREFSGVLVIGDGSKMLATLAEIMVLAYEDQGDSARLYSAASR
jgi:transmembrane sensor